MVPHSPKKKQHQERTIATRNTPLITSGSDQQNPVVLNKNHTSNMERNEGIPPLLVTGVPATPPSTPVIMPNIRQTTLHCQTQSEAISTSGSNRETLQFQPSSVSLQNLRQIICALKAPAPPVPEFYGLNHEDPEVFLRECEIYFVQTGIDESQWTRTAGKTLQDEAAKWWAPFKTLNMPWNKFCELFRNKYASQKV